VQTGAQRLPLRPVSPLQDLDALARTWETGEMGEMGGARRLMVKQWSKDGACTKVPWTRRLDGRRMATRVPGWKPEERSMDVIR
jgi:hypothetical protein